MLLGIDVGGTHTDAVLIDDGGIRGTFKTPTDHADLLSSVRAVLDWVAAEGSPSDVERVNLSTTLTTNAIIEGTTEEVGLLVVGGPGIDPHTFQLCRHFHVLSGSTDHRGSVVRELDRAEMEAAAAACEADGVRAFAAVGKFSPRNPAVEEQIAAAIGERADVVTMGHTLTGRLGFPRRMATAYFNSAVWRLFNQFSYAVEQSLRERGIAAKVNILKADGGTMPLSTAKRIPVESILSGPAASVMGIVSMCDIALDSLILDVGGTTTDIAVFAGGAPLMEPSGISIGSYPTLVRALRTTSIGVGGDSAISMLGEEIFVGPRRLGPCMCSGGERPALMDAFNYLGEASLGDVAASRRGIEEFAASHSLSPDFVARKAADTAVASIAKACRALIEEINARPVYTLHELIEGRRIVPKKIYLMGGPAEILKDRLFKEFKLSVGVPRNYDVANAVGAALTRTTTGIELFADTEKRRMYVPTLGVSRIVERGYSLDDAERDARRALLNHLRHEGIPVREENLEMTHAESFNMVEGGVTAGRNIRVGCQIRPGILHRYKALLGRLC
ncbi:Hydantoinase/oxoprolinase [Desulfovibrio sp. X2]|uniref:hydantoinase/oxoprolinase family protein n=1 Tax=Desulfovibrio sp. X2 TaxID=941449 RepID=UPI000358BD17|nr:hydantoinase/oxoprolinase family protein [Desulfovibrio sp. X2]EPR44718.1 Hydantoinase/oxoprolinase [Desulfovibrio sp. X2]